MGQKVNPHGLRAVSYTHLDVYKRQSDYYATDPFHEGGNTGGMSPTVIAEKVLANMMEADENGIWIIQSWQGNPSTALLQGLDAARDHALVLDLYAEKTPHWNETDPGSCLLYTSSTHSMYVFSLKNSIQKGHRKTELR